MGVALKGISILIVEDDPDTRDLLRVLLESDGGLVVRPPLSRRLFRHTIAGART